MHEDETKEGLSMVNVSFHGEKLSVVVWEKSAIELVSKKLQVNVVV
jgi:hypothetical protein